MPANNSSSDLLRFFKHSSIYAIGNLINRLGAFLLLPVYTNYLTVGEYGTLELFYVVMSVISGVLAVGLAHATLRYYFDFKNENEKKSLVSTNYIGSLAITIIGTGILALFSDKISSLAFQERTLQVGILIILVTIVFEISSQICLAYVRAIEYSIFFVVISILKLIVQISVNTYLVIVVEAGVVGVLVGNLCTVVLGWLILSYFTLSRCGIRFDANKFIPVLRYCFPFLLSTIMGIIVTQADKVILNRLISIEALGIYALALKFSMILEQMIGEPFNRSYGAYRYTIMEQENAPNIQSSIVKYLAITALLFALGISFFAEELILLISKNSYWPAIELIPILMIASVFKILTYPMQTGILYEKKTRYLFYLTSMAAAISITGNLLLIRVIGIYGACVSLVITEFSLLYVTHKISSRFFEVKYENTKIASIFLLAMFAYLPVLFIEFDSFYSSIGVKILLLSIFCAGVIKLPILSQHEKKQIRDFILSRMSAARAK